MWFDLWECMFAAYSLFIYGEYLIIVVNTLYYLIVVYEIRGTTFDVTVFSPLLPKQSK